QHFDRLEDKELLERKSVAKGPGRPTLEYRLTPAGQGLFPSQNGRLFGQILEFLMREGYPGLVDAFFRQMWRQRTDALVEGFDEAGATELEERLEVVEDFLEEEGFVPDIDTEGDCVTIRECNCPYSEAVRATRLPCRLEAKFLENALQREVSRVGYMPDGHPTCVYEFHLDDEENDAA
ncbi:MAG: helix-turn-helix transcriptional regulator, partial [Persicimonas sp.]